MAAPRDAEPEVVVRTARADDIPEIIDMTRRVYPGRAPWRREQLESHLRIFPRGQLVAEHVPTGKVVGMAAGLIINWDDYEPEQSWRDFTDRGMFTNHDPENGRTLYGAEVMVHPEYRRRGIGRKIYEARRRLVKDLNLVRIRAHARLSGYRRFADELEPEEYVRRVVRGELSDPTLTFQLSEGFQVLDVVSNNLLNDPESLGHAALIEWLNPELASPADYARRARRFHADREGGRVGSEKPGPS